MVRLICAPVWIPTQDRISNTSLVKFWTPAVEPEQHASLLQAAKDMGFQFEGSCEYWLVDLGKPAKLKTHFVTLTRYCVLR